MKVAVCVISAIAAIAVLPGCGRVKVEGSYRDVENPAISYIFNADGTWRAEKVSEVGAGIFPHGSGRRLHGTFGRKGNIVELKCVEVSREEPMSGEFRSEPVDVSAYDHRLRVEERALVPVAAKDGAESVFASDINPLGARRLVPPGE